MLVFQAQLFPANSLFICDILCKIICLFIRFCFPLLCATRFFSLLHAVIVSLLPLDLLVVFDVQYAYIYETAASFHVIPSWKLFFFAALFGKLFFPLHFHFTRCNVFFVYACVYVCVCAISSAFFFEMV